MAQPPIIKEKKQKEMLKVYIFCAVLAYIYMAFVIFHVEAIQVDDPRVGMLDAINRATTEVFTIPLHLSITGSSISAFLLIGVGIAAVGAIMIAQKQLTKHDNPDTVKGQAHLMTADELKEYNMKRTDPIGKVENDGPNNMILSADIRLALDGRKTRRNCNILAIGGSGAGKTRYFAAPNILQFNTNLIITDPSGETLNDYGKALEDNGYLVKVFNISDVYKGNRYNPLAYINAEKDVDILVNTLIKNTTPADGHAGDPFWEKSETLLLSALILYIWHTYPKEKRTFAVVLDLLNKAEIDENDASSESELDQLFAVLEKDDPHNLAVRRYHSFKLGAGKTLKGILISVAVRLGGFNLPDIQYLTGADEFEFEKFADSKQALFVIIPTADTTFNFLVSLMYSQLFTSLYDYVEKRAQYGWQVYVDNLNILRVFQVQSASESSDAQKKADAFLEILKHGTRIVPDKEKKLFYIKTVVGYDKTAKQQLIAIKQTIITDLHAVSQQPVYITEEMVADIPKHMDTMTKTLADLKAVRLQKGPAATINKHETEIADLAEKISEEFVAHDFETCAAHLTRCKALIGNCKNAITDDPLSQQKLVTARKQLQRALDYATTKQNEINDKVTSEIKNQMKHLPRIISEVRDAQLKNGVLCALLTHEERLRKLADAIKMASQTSDYKVCKKFLTEAKVLIEKIRLSADGEILGWKGEKAQAVAFQESLKNAHKRPNPRRCPYHVRFILDEFANIGQIPDFDAKLATIRKYEISVAIILQALSQLKDLYKYKWNTIAANCDTKLFLGCDDTETIKWLLEMLGEKTTIVQNTSYQEKGKGSTSYNRDSIALLTIDQITMMADDECVVRIKGERPYFGKKYPLEKHPNYQHAQNTATTFRISGHEDAELAREDLNRPLLERQMEQGIHAGDMAAKEALRINAAIGTSSEVHEETDVKNEDNPYAPEPGDSGNPYAPADETGTPATSAPSNANAQDAKNAARKKEAKQNKQYGEVAPITADEEQMIMEGLNAFHLTPGASDAEIKESVETMLQIEKAPTVLSFGSTG